MPLTRPKLRQINTTTSQFNDPILEINSSQDSGSAMSSDAGIVINRGTDGDRAAILWDRSTNEFVIGITSATHSDSGDITVTTDANLRVNQLTTGGSIQYPTVDGTADEYLITDGAGILSFTSEIDGGSY